MDDLVTLLIYAVIILVSVIASAYQAKKRRMKTDPRNMPGESDADQQQIDRPDFGPLADFFDLPSQSSQKTVFESVEEGPSIAESGFDVEKSRAYDGLESRYKEDKKRIPEEITVSAEGRFEEGQSDLQKTADQYTSIQQEIEADYSMDDISAGEIVSEEEEAAKSAAKADKQKPSFDIRTAIIYSEILKRKEF